MEYLTPEETIKLAIRKLEEDKQLISQVFNKYKKDALNYKNDKDYSIYSEDFIFLYFAEFDFENNDFVKLTKINSASIHDNNDSFIEYDTGEAFVGQFKDYIEDYVYGSYNYNNCTMIVIAKDSTEIVNKIYQIQEEALK